MNVRNIILKYTEFSNLLTSLEDCIQGTNCKKEIKYYLSLYLRLEKQMLCPYSTLYKIDLADGDMDVLINVTKSSLSKYLHKRCESKSYQNLLDKLKTQREQHEHNISIKNN